MNALKQQTARAVRGAFRAAIVALLIVAILFVPSSAMAARKKKKEEDAAPTKSYVLPYFIVMMLLGVGLMTVCRPGSRQDRVDDKRRREKEEL